jgi:phage shock protein A
MAGMMGRLSGIFKAKINKAMDAAENPAEMLDLSYEQMIEQLQQIRRSIADVATAKAQLQQQLGNLQAQEQRLDGQAHQALAANRDDLARAALARKAVLAPQVQALAGQVEGLQQQEDKLLDGQSRLSAKIEAFHSQKEAMKAQYTAAQASVRINEFATGLSEEWGDVQLQMERAQNKIEGMQARATALDELVGDAALPELGPGATDEIGAELARIGAASDVEAQLQAMKNALPGPGGLPQIEGPQERQTAPNSAPEGERR